MSKRKIGDNRYKFTFSRKETFNAKAFFEMYKTADFLDNPKNITKILSQGHELRDCVESVSPWDQVTIEGMFLKPRLDFLLRPDVGTLEYGTVIYSLPLIRAYCKGALGKVKVIYCIPLVIKKSCRQDESDISEQEFTFRRLSGLAAAVAFTEGFHCRRVPEAEALGLESNKDMTSFKLYLSAVSGAELFVDHFDVFPFICALRKFQLKKISAEAIQHIADIPNVDGELTLKRLRRKLHTDEEMKEYEKKFSDVTFNISSSLIQYNLQLSRSKISIWCYLLELLLYAFIFVFVISAFSRIVPWWMSN